MKSYILLILSFFTSICVTAQIVATGNTDESTTVYPTHPENHPVFLFANLLSGGLSATPEVNAEYNWFSYNNGMWTDLGSSNSPELMLDLQELGYRVDVKVGGVLKSSNYCWVFKPEIESVGIDTLSVDCTYAHMQTNLSSKTLTYYDISSQEAVNLMYSYTYNWESDSDDDLEEIDLPDPALPSPVEKTIYSLTVNAFNGASQMTSNELEISAIAVSAEYTATVSERDNENEITSSDSYSAPVLVNFEDQSLGTITDREWIFFNTAIEGTEGEIGADYDVLRPNFVFTEFGTYNAKLTILNRDSGCEDTYTGDEINVIEMEVLVGNAFTPNGDGVHDRFEVRYKSVDTFRMVIFNRWGRKVYETTYPGEGWNGKMGGRDAKEGIYFYYIEAKGFNEGEHVKLEGPIHLVR